MADGTDCDLQKMLVLGAEQDEDSARTDAVYLCCNWVAGK